MVELKEGWLKIQFQKAIEYYNSLPQWRKDMTPKQKSDQNWFWFWGAVVWIVSLIFLAILFTRLK